MRKRLQKWLVQPLINKLIDQIDAYSKHLQDQHVLLSNRIDALERENKLLKKQLRIAIDGE
jgi:hypothetical protein